MRETTAGARQGRLAGKEVGSHPPGVHRGEAGCGQSEGAAGDPVFQTAATSAEAYQSAQH